MFLLHTAPNVFSFPVFTVSFCQQFMEELDHFEQSDIPKGRPNTMNNSGVSITRSSTRSPSMHKNPSVCSALGLLAAIGWYIT